MKKCRNIDRAMAARSHLFVQGGITTKDWFSLKLQQTHEIVNKTKQPD